jgi:hypothetical protein
MKTVNLSLRPSQREWDQSQRKQHSYNLKEIQRLIIGHQTFTETSGFKETAINAVLITLSSPELSLGIAS